MTAQEMTYGEDYKFIPATSLRSGEGTEVRPDVFAYTIQIANIGLVGDPQSGTYVLIDAGMPKSGDDVHKGIEKLFGGVRPPSAIILTHGHFDHVGSLIELVQEWNVPVYAHTLELPYLTGQEDYPKPDPTVEGGLVAQMSIIFPHEAINLGSRVRPLPQDGPAPDRT